MLSWFSIVMSVIAGLLVLIFLFYIVTHCIRCVQEKEQVIVERLGVYSRTMSAGINCMIPFLDRTKKIYIRYLADSDKYAAVVVEKYSDLISTQNEVIDFPEQYLCLATLMLRPVITRDNAKIYLDAVVFVRFSYG